MQSQWRLSPLELYSALLCGVVAAKSLKKNILIVKLLVAFRDTFVSILFLSVVDFFFFPHSISKRFRLTSTVFIITFLNCLVNVCDFKLHFTLRFVLLCTLNFKK